jgi:hypothetical protein
MIGSVFAPIFAPVGFGTWQAAVAFITGLLAKETVVSTFGTIFGVGEDGLATVLPTLFTPLSALSYMVFCLLSGPCAAHFGTVKQETNSWKWTIFSFALCITIGYIVAFILNTRITFIIAIVIAFITSRILEDKVTGSFLQIIDENNQFLYGNIRYFIVSLGEGIGAFLAGLFLTKSFGFLFLGAAIITIIQTIIMLYLDKLKRKFN